MIKNIYPSRPEATENHGTSENTLYAECYYNMLNCARKSAEYIDRLISDWCGINDTIPNYLYKPVYGCSADFTDRLPSKIYFGISPSPYGYCLLAGNDDTITYLSFIDPPLEKHSFPYFLSGAIRDDAYAYKTASALFWNPLLFKPYIAAGVFETCIYLEQMKIPQGQTSTYAGLCSAAGYPGKFRACGRALSKNNIAYLIPCHRTIYSDGTISGYKWGYERKKLMLLRERLICENQKMNCISDY